MRSYSTSMQGSFKVERVDVLPNWTTYDVGRFLYDLSTKTFYLGASSIDFGSKGWITVGLSDRCIKNYHIDWDNQLTNKFGTVSAKDVPVLYKNKPNNVQDVISLAEQYFEAIKNGTFLETGCIKDYHLDISTIHAVTADSIPYTNSEYFSIIPEIGKPFFSTEDAIKYVYTRPANEINLENSNRSDKFGSLLQLDAKTVQDALERLEQYLAHLTASQVSVVYPGCECKTNVQVAIDSLYKICAQGAFIDLADTPVGYNAGKFVKSTTTGLSFDSISSSEVTVTAPGLSNPTLQDFIDNNYDNLQKLDKKIESLTAADIHFNYSSTNYNFTNVDQSIKYILNNYFGPLNLPSANEVTCIPIGDPQNNNVQLALSYLANTVSTISNSFSCATTVFTVNNNEHTLSQILEYIMGFINHMIDNEGISYPKL